MAVYKVPQDVEADDSVIITSYATSNDYPCRRYTTPKNNFTYRKYCHSVSKTYAVDQVRWATLTIAEQMGNIYSEVGRSLAALRRHNITDRDHAVIRAIDLFDATVMALVAKKSPRTKEVLRAKDQFLQAIYGEIPPRQN